MRVKSVQTRQDLKEFIQFPWQINKNDPYWVPPLLTEAEKILDPKKNPFWDHAERQLFLAVKEGKVVGRIAGIVDHNYIKFHNEKVGFFGFFEAVDDYQVAELLLSQVKQWLKARGMRSMRGPLNPSQNEECGLLIDGFYSSPSLLMTYNARYYAGLIERFGLRKAMDLYAYYAPVYPQPPELLAHAADFARRKLPEAKVRPFNLKCLEEEAQRVKRIYNSAWERNWGFVPLTDKELDFLVERLRPLAIPDLALFVEVGGKPVGFILVVPDYNQAIKHCNGRLFPFGWMKLLYYSRKITDIRLVIMGVLKEYRMNGLEALLYYTGNQNAYRLGYKGVEFSWILESNVLTRRAAENYGGKIYKTYRIYEMRI